MQTRRKILKQLSLGTTALAIPFKLSAAVSKPAKAVKLGVITDLHLGFVEGASVRLTAFLDAMKTEKLDALLQLGDFLHSKPEYQPDADRFNAAHEHTLHVIGNHDIRDAGLKRADCLKAWKMPAPYYTQVISGIRFIILDGNEPGSPTHHKHGGYPSYIGKKQQVWLEQVLKDSKEPVVILCHQPFVGTIELDNAKEMRDLVAKYSDKIIICLNGHSHVDQHIRDRGIHYLHVNSASYYWLGGKVKMARYKDPLFCTLTIDPESSIISVRGKQSTWLNGSPEDVNYFTGKHAHMKDIVQPKISSRKLNY